MLSSEKTFAKHLLTFFVVSVASTALLVGINAYGRTAQNPEGFVAYDEARSSYMDYPHDSYQSNPALYEQAGWDETLAALTSNWFYMDERVTTEAFTTISSGSAFAQSTATDRLANGVEGLGGFFESFPLAAGEVFLLRGAGQAGASFVEAEFVEFGSDAF